MAINADRSPDDNERINISLIAEKVLRHDLEGADAQEDSLILSESREENLKKFSDLGMRAFEAVYYVSESDDINFLDDEGFLFYLKNDLQSKVYAKQSFDDKDCQYTFIVIGGDNPHLDQEAESYKFEFVFGCKDHMLQYETNPYEGYLTIKGTDGTTLAHVTMGIAKEQFSISFADGLDETKQNLLLAKTSELIQEIEKIEKIAIQEKRDTARDQVEKLLEAF